MSVEQHRQQYTLLRDSLYQVYKSQLGFEYGYATMYRYMKLEMGLSQPKIEHRNLVYAKGMIMKNLNDYTLYRLSINPPLESRALPKMFLQ